MSMSELRCYCSHTKGQHRKYEGECDNCMCGKFRMDLSITTSETDPSHTESTSQEASAAEQRGAAESGLKDSGKRIEFNSGMVRDVADDKPGFQFLLPKNVPYNEQMLTRVAVHLQKGAKKYEPRNWEKGDSDEEAERARESALRHMMQWLNGETDEDHAAATIINVIFAETMQYKANRKKENPIA